MMVTDDTEFMCGNIEKLFEEARRNTKIQQEKWAKYYNKRRREVNIKVKDLVLVRIYHQRERDEDVEESEGSDNNRCKATQSEGSGNSRPRVAQSEGL
ncbi:hypothetical protein TNCV_5064412 [Trichonephila clavipes]|nr:hypothetical protein TNCV_5064412 [Trichonephila clavipes]